MADESLVNGAVAETEADGFFDSESDVVKKVEELEREKEELKKRNEEVKRMEEEVLGLRREKEEMEEVVRKAEEDGKALGAIKGRAADLETEVARLQDELASAMSEGDDANKELNMVNSSLKEVKARAEELEKEKGRLVGEVEEVRKGKAVVEVKVGELESKLKVVTEELKETLAFKEDDFVILLRKVADLSNAVGFNEADLVEEKAAKKILKDALEASEAYVIELETKLVQLEKKAEEAEKVTSELKENTAKAINGVIDRDAVLDKNGSGKGPIDVKLAAVGAGVTAVVVGGAICLLYAKKR